MPIAVSEITCSQISSGRHSRQKPCGVRSAESKIEPTPRIQCPMTNPRAKSPKRFLQVIIPYGGGLSYSALDFPRRGQAFLAISNRRGPITDHARTQIPSPGDGRGDSASGRVAVGL